MQQCKNSKRRELTEEERVPVILLYKEGKTYHKIGEEIGTSRTTIGRIDWTHLNPIKSVWGIFKKRYRKAVWKRKRIPCN
ncbi:hypothetical protein L873DRAFT_1823104, partial [Choiromyces venosus 120613-1]